MIIAFEPSNEATDVAILYLIGTAFTSSAVIPEPTQTCPYLSTPTFTAEVVSPVGALA